MFGYRTSVLNDFSIVQKGKFYVFDRTTLGGKIKYTPTTDVYTLQINPENFEAFDGRTQLEQGQGVTEDGVPYANFTNVGNDRNQAATLSIGLRYDIFDEYMARTMNDMNPAGGLMGIDLFSEDFVSLQGLRNLSLESMTTNLSTQKRVLFKWGVFEYFGTLSSLEFTYEKFSRWGNPLAGNGRAVITNEKLFDRRGSVVSKPTRSPSLIGAGVVLDDDLDKLRLSFELTATKTPELASDTIIKALR